MSGRTARLEPTRQRVDRQAEIVVSVEPDTTMRDRRRAGSNSYTNNDLQAPAAFALELAQVERIFRPEELDVDNLVEAVRALLEHDGAPHLLSLPPRGTHVVEATGTR